jgi:Pyruvate/2-oxoacid:ferredoxin oxidoreductase delta subunit
MRSLFRRTTRLAVEFCDGCGRVCDAACGREALIRHMRDQTPFRGGRL